VAIGIIPGDPDLAAKAFADLKMDLDEEKAAQLTAQVEVDVQTREVKDLQIFANMFANQMPTLEDKIKHLEDKVEDGLK
jgi:DNA-binding MurR/RpiR family transcriptional regulator